MNTDITRLLFVRPTLLKVVKAHIALKEYDKAIEEAKKHVDNEESVEGLHALGEAQLGGERWEEGVRTFQRAFEIAVSGVKLEMRLVIRFFISYGLSFDSCHLMCLILLLSLSYANVAFVLFTLTGHAHTKLTA